MSSAASATAAASGRCFGCSSSHTARASAVGRGWFFGHASANIAHRFPGSLLLGLRLRARSRGWRTVRRRAPGAGQRALDARHAVTQYMESRRRLALAHGSPAAARRARAATVPTVPNRVVKAKLTGTPRLPWQVSERCVGSNDQQQASSSANAVSAEAVKPARGRQRPVTRGRSPREASRATARVSLRSSKPPNA